MQTFTLTFGDVAENHTGMQKIGKEAEKGLTFEELQSALFWFSEKGCNCDLYELNQLLPEGFEGEKAYFLIIRNGLSALTKASSSEFFEEQERLDKDTKAFMYGRVVNKKARHNLCFGPENSEPDYQQGRGRVVSFDQIPLLTQVRNSLVQPFGQKAQDLMVEGNYYYDIQKCFIGFHGDSERKIVIGLRLGQPFPLHFQWFGGGQKIGQRVEFSLNNGDVYAMSSKTVGSDWKRKKILTLRHAAGSVKSLKL